MSINNKIKISYSIIAVTLLLVYGCQNQDARIERALSLAKSNRPELEKVLEHYQHDSLKLEAAKFLIRNMPGHYSPADSSINKYYDAIDSTLHAMKNHNVDEIKYSLERISDRFCTIIKDETVPDVEIITSEYLIANIDTAFAQWQEGPWSKHLNFEQFCECLLPYKTEDLQSLDNWKEYLKTTYNQKLENLKYCDLYKNSALRAAIQVNSNLKNDLHPVLVPSRMTPVYRMSTRVKLPFGMCDDYTEIATAVFRSNGIPVFSDFTPQWPFRSMGHTWNVLLNNNGKNLSFGGADTNPGDPHKLDEHMAKAFRRTYAANSELEELQATEKYIPSTFSTPFIKDVTPEYTDCVDVKLEVNGKNGKFAYLSVFNNHTWTPIDFARIKHGKAHFKNMGKNIVYLPVYYEENEWQLAIADPFVLTYKGEVKKLIPDTLKRQTLVLHRKYPVFPHLNEGAERLYNGEFQVADNPDFKNAKVVHKIKQWGTIGMEANIPDSCGKYRYWRYYQPEEYCNCNIAEIYFVERENHSFIEGEIIGTDGAWNNNENYNKTKVFDHNLLTSFDAPTSNGAWVGMDFGKPVDIEKILFTARGDGNTIDIGDTYELFYWGNGHWNSLGKQKANTVTLEYKNVPTGALYWLRDLTKGEEERIFTYENGKQIWW